MSTFESLNIICADGYALAARYYPNQYTQAQRLPVLICPATGITKSFYHAFATWLNEQGYAVLCFDFRGIGDSLHEPLKQCNASIVDWGQLDIPAAVNTLLQKTQAEQVVLLGHSAGGQLLGINPEYHKVAKVVAVWLYRPRKRLERSYSPACSSDV